MLRIFEAELVGDFADGQTGLNEQLLGTFDDSILNVALGGGAALFADQVAEVIGRQAGFIGEIGYRGQAVLFWMTVFEILLQMLMERGDDVAVHLVACDELAVVVTHAVVQEQAYSIGDERL